LNNNVQNNRKGNDVKEQREQLVNLLGEPHYENEANICGAAGVIRCHGGAGFYCTVHKHEIQPLLYEVGDEEIPCCEECVLEEMIEQGREVRTPETVDPIVAAVGDHTDTSGVSWESLT
jgi:hypothetical protein